MKVLVAEDSLVSRHLLEVTLRRWGYDPVPAGDGSEAWEILQREDAPSLAILDWMMPGLTGPEICRLVRERAREPYTYILLLTSRSDKADMVEGMDAGADDYISKPFEHNELQVRLRAGHRIVDLQTELLAARETLRERATRDSLTGAWNRHTFLEILEKEVARGVREKRPVSLVILDLDHFKKVNDSRGHLSGDAVLREVVARVNSTLRPYDAVGRYGGEEFLIALPGCDAEQAISQAERTCVLIGSHPVIAAGFSIPITASFGIATLSETVTDVRTLIHLADKALYRAKSQGRNCVVHLAGTPADENPESVEAAHAVE